MKVAFLCNKLTIRGDNVAMYDYAHFNETLLGNQSVIITRDFNKIMNHFDVDIKAYLKFKRRFPVFYYEKREDLDVIVEREKIDVLYIIKSGTLIDGLITNKCKCVIHCVFELNNPHGDVYASVSPSVNKMWNTNYPVVPHMIYIPEVVGDLREELNIPKSNIVFGRYGGKETFDLKFAQQVVVKVASENPNYTFLFMNTYRFCDLKNVIFLEGNTDMIYKRKFINTCDAMIHGGARGETFGIACGEFSVCKKPVIVYNQPNGGRSHLEILGEKAVIYNNPNELYEILKQFDPSKYNMENNGYMNYNPENVMKIFKEVFLS